MDRQLSDPVRKLHMRGHPSPVTYNVIMTGAWGWFSYRGVTFLAGLDHDHYVARFFAALMVLAMMAMALLNVYSVVTHRERCKKFHAAEHVIIAALDEYPVTQEETDAIMEARRG